MSDEFHGPIRVHSGGYVVADPVSRVQMARAAAEGIAARTATAGYATTAPATVARSMSAEALEAVTVHGYGLVWRQAGPSEDRSESLSIRGPEVIRNRDQLAQVPLRLGHGPHDFGGPTLAERPAEVRSDPSGMYFRWVIEPWNPELTPALRTWLTSGERGLSPGWVNLRPLAETRYPSGRAFLSATDVWVSHIAVMPPRTDGRQAQRWAGAHTLGPFA
jgi:hypothetical protein